MQAKREYEIENDSVASFIDENTELDKDGYEVCSFVYSEYKYFCQQSGLYPVSRPNFTIRMKSMGFNTAVKWVNGKSQRCYLKLTI